MDLVNERVTDKGLKKRLREEVQGYVMQGETKRVDYKGSLGHDERGYFAPVWEGEGVVVFEKGNTLVGLLARFPPNTRNKGKGTYLRFYSY